MPKLPKEVKKWIDIAKEDLSVAREVSKWSLAKFK